MCIHPIPIPHNPTNPFVHATLYLPASTSDNVMRPQYHYSDNNARHKQQENNPKTPANPRPLPRFSLLASKPRVSV
jgi:hypothetical protein